MNNNYIKKENDVKEIYCPLCEDWVFGSDYLFNNIKEIDGIWVANMITHYRHEHRNWDNQWGYISRFHNYDDAKLKVNNQIKRVLLRKKIFKKFIIDNKITKNAFLSLTHNDDKVLKYIENVFGDGNITDNKL
jgi:hypothetical protein